MFCGDFSGWKPGGCVGSGCVSFPPPTVPETASPWDVLSVEMLNTKFVLRRCSLVSTPLTTDYRGYTSGQTVPFWQPDGVGPPLLDNGAYIAEADRRVSLTHGPNAENPDDGTTPANQPGTGGSRQPGRNSLGQWKHSATFDNHPTDSVKWGVNGLRGDVVTPEGAEGYSQYVRVSQPDSDGVRHAWFSMGGYNDGVQGDPFKLVRWRLDNGTPVVRAFTVACVENLSVAYGGIGINNASRNNNRIAIGPTKQVVWQIYQAPASGNFKWETRWFEVSLEDGSNATWIEEAEVTAERQLWEEGPAPACWCWDDSDYFLEITSLPDTNQTVLFRNGPNGRQQWATLSGQNIYPECYQKRAGLHVVGMSDGSVRVYDECGSVDWSYDTNEAMYYVNVLANGWIVAVTAGGLRRIDENGVVWSIDASANASVLPSGCSATQETYYGAIQVRGVPIDSADHWKVNTFLDPGYWPGRTFLGSQDRISVSNAWSLDPDDPTAGGITLGTQQGVDNTTSDWLAETGGFGAPQGPSDIVHFQGHVLSEFDSVQEAVERLPSLWAEAANGLPYGATAAPRPGNIDSGGGPDPGPQPGPIAPSATVPSSITTDEDTPVTVTGIDVAGSASQTHEFQISVTNGVLNVNLDGATVTAGASGTASVTLSGTPAQINASVDDLQYSPNSGFSGSDTINYNLSNGGLLAQYSTAVTVNAAVVNIGPTITVPASFSVAVGETVSVPGFDITDDLFGGDSVRFRFIGSDDVTWSVTLQGSATVVTGSNNSNFLEVGGTLADVRATIATAQATGVSVGNTNLQIRGRDAEGATDLDFILANVSAAPNNAPTITTPGAQTTDEDTAKTITGISVADADGDALTLILSASDGTITLNLDGATVVSGANGSGVMTIGGSAAQINASIDDLLYTPPSGFTGDATISLVVSDGTASAGGLVTITVNEVVVVNQPPTVTVPDDIEELDFGTTTGVSGAAVSDDGVGGDSVTVTISGASQVTWSAGGTGTVSGNQTSSITISGTVSQVNNSLATLQARGVADGTGTATFAVADIGGLTDSGTISVEVLPEPNTAPTLSVPPSVTTDEDVAVAVSPVTAADAEGDTLTLAISATHGDISFTLSGATVTAGAVGSSSVTIQGTAAQLNSSLSNLTYDPDTGYFGSDTISYTLSDGSLSDTGSTGVTVNEAVPTNTAPELTVPLAANFTSPNRRAMISFGTLAVSDTTPSAGTYTLRIFVGGGTLDVLAGSGATVDDNNSDDLLISGSLAAVDNTIRSLFYDPPSGDANYTISYTLTEPGGLQDTDQTQVTVGLGD